MHHDICLTMNTKFVFQLLVFGELTSVPVSFIYVFEGHLEEQGNLLEAIWGDMYCLTLHE